MVGTADSVLIREVSLTESVLYREVPLYLYVCTCYVCALVCLLCRTLPGVLYHQPSSLTPRSTHTPPHLPLPFLMNSL